MMAIKRSINNSIESPITISDVEEVKKIVKSSVSYDDIKKMENFVKNQ